MKLSIIGLSLEGLLSPNTGWKECVVKRRGGYLKATNKRVRFKKSFA